MPDWQLIAERLRWQDIADIAILTLVAYRVYRWLSGTVALQVLGGMGVLLLAGLASQRAGLMLTGYVLQAIGAVALVVAVVVFQNEIRRALRGFDPIRWWRHRRANGDGPRQPFSRLADAVASLARDRLGALIVLPRIDEVDEHLTGGTPLDARLSTELFEAIFNEASPIHDGAAVVRRGRVDRAGAFLPLASGNQLPDAFGTRHRAAVGLSEACDAIVLVVSEERGAISIASGGRLTTAPSDPDALADRLGKVMRSGGSPAGRMITGWTDDDSLGGKRRRWVDALALVAILAVVSGSWYALAGDRSTLIAQTMPVELRNAPEGTAVDVVRPSTGVVSVRLRGPRQLLYSRARDDVNAWVNLEGLELGTRRREVETSAPPGLEVVGVEPADIAVKLTRERKQE